MVQAKMGGSYELEIGSNEPLGRGGTLEVEEKRTKKIYTHFLSAPWDEEEEKPF